ncbi:MAG: hypothetical protein GWN99_09795 [Gemmatimonadetes bacterium]|uniref:Sec-independent protein translocase protein TatA n=1 Tax=Candidatus Kutchimonas denitrificans TaxID=3056748 RepID=A0AAE5CB94_9BACT|nr:hypothetical protein [Gemmatimonadota bacterium]NIR74160.1 hypothetical protein [Candidatus Kutchimonas denitrificans]NIS01342.1 hypothetical protein [Gemmatimonadota bacterium]NIT67073.1 hypothetical protein [Gemmatimonadota bacterium]NIU51733.1 hypothetical protein [Gemmatimonadota bacterium]
MGIGNIGWSEFLVILAIALIFFGPRRLPAIAQTIGKTLREFQKALNEVKSEIAQADRESKETRSYVRSMLPNPPAAGGSPGTETEIPEDSEPEVTGEGQAARPAASSAPTPRETGGPTDRAAEEPGPERAEEEPGSEERSSEDEDATDKDLA